MTNTQSQMQHAKQVIAALEDLVNQTDGLSYSGVARAIGVSSSTLSLWRSMEYKGVVDRVTKKVESYLQSYRQRKQARKLVLPYYPTRSTKKIIELAKICHAYSKIGIAYGKSGIGKSCGVQEYLKSDPNALLIEVDETYTKKVMLEDIASQLGIKTEKNTSSELMREIVRDLTGTNRLLIVDETEFLGTASLNTLRRIWDKTGGTIGILLVGHPSFVAKLRSHRVDKEYLYSRIGVGDAIKHAHPKDIQQIITDQLPGASDSLWKEIYNTSTGNIRIVENILEGVFRLMDINGTGQVTLEMVKKTINTLVLQEKQITEPRFQPVK